jgi:hypothetical protein
MDLLFSIILSLQKCNIMLIYPTDHIESITALMIKCVGYIVCGDRWADLVIWDYGLTVPTRNRTTARGIDIVGFSPFLKNQAVGRKAGEGGQGRSQRSDGREQDG